MLKDARRYFARVSALSEQKLESDDKHMEWDISINDYLRLRTHALEAIKGIHMGVGGLSPPHQDGLDLLRATHMEDRWQKTLASELQLARQVLDLSTFSLSIENKRGPSFEALASRRMNEKMDEIMGAIQSLGPCEEYVMPTGWKVYREKRDANGKKHQQRHHAYVSFRARRDQDVRTITVRIDNRTGESSRHVSTHDTRSRRWIYPYVFQPFCLDQSTMDRLLRPWLEGVVRAVSRPPEEREATVRAIYGAPLPKMAEAQLVERFRPSLVQPTGSDVVAAFRVGESIRCSAQSECVRIGEVRGHDLTGCKVWITTGTGTTTSTTKGSIAAVQQQGSRVVYTVVGRQHEVIDELAFEGSTITNRAGCVLAPTDVVVASTVLQMLRCSERAVIQAYCNRHMQYQMVVPTEPTVLSSSEVEQAKSLQWEWAGRRVVDRLEGWSGLSEADLKELANKIGVDDQDFEMFWVLRTLQETMRDRLEMTAHERGLPDDQSVDPSTVDESWDEFQRLLGGEGLADSPASILFFEVMNALVMQCKSNPKGYLSARSLDHMANQRVKDATVRYVHDTVDMASDRDRLLRGYAAVAMLSWGTVTDEALYAVSQLVSAGPVYESGVVSQ